MPSARTVLTGAWLARRFWTFASTREMTVISANGIMDSNLRLSFSVWISAREERTLYWLFHRYLWQQRNDDSQFISMHLIEACSLRRLNFPCWFPFLPSLLKLSFFAAFWLSYFMALISHSSGLSPDLCSVNCSSNQLQITSEMHFWKVLKASQIWIEFQKTKHKTNTYLI